jgi:alkylation response protein AidB-like acyl-CoA dehydrogenase
MTMDLGLTREEQDTVEIASQFARDHVAPNAAAWEAKREHPRAALEQAAAVGLVGLLVPKDLGGKGFSFTALVRILEELAYADVAFAFAVVVHNNLMFNIARNGNDEQRARFLPPLMAMDKVGCFMLTEPNAGSDATALQTRARRDGGNWVIDGAKAWVSNAANGGTLSVYAQTDPEQGHRGIACFIVDAEAPGVVREDPYALLGAHALGTGGFRFEGCVVSDDDILVPPGEGFKAAMAGIDLARAAVAAMCTGMMQCGLDTAVAYMKGRTAFGRPISEFQGLQWQLADVATDLHAARLMAYDAVGAIDRGEVAAIAAAHAKKFATRAALRGISECMQAMGANGLKQETPLARHLAAAKTAQYLDGSTEIQNVVISRELFG